jgi:hypothetical protein
VLVAVAKVDVDVPVERVALVVEVVLTELVGIGGGGEIDIGGIEHSKQVAS